MRKHFPNALIVTDRFHVIRLINHHFLGCWRDLDAAGSKNRGLLSLMRRHRHNLKPEQVEKLTAYLRTNPALEEEMGEFLPSLYIGQGKNPETGSDRLFLMSHFRRIGHGIVDPVRLCDDVAETAFH